MKTLSPFLILICIVFLSACKKETKPYTPLDRCSDFTNSIDSISKYIQGTWERMEEIRYERQTGLTYFHPDISGWRKFIYKYSGDTLRAFNNGLADSVYRFKIQRESDVTLYPTDTLPVIVNYSFYTGIRASYFRVQICKNQLLMLFNYRSDVVGDWLCLRR